MTTLLLSITSTARSSVTVATVSSTSQLVIVVVITGWLSFCSQTESRWVTIPGSPIVIPWIRSVWLLLPSPPPGTMYYYAINNCHSAGDWMEKITGNFFYYASLCGSLSYSRNSFSPIGRWNLLDSFEYSHSSSGCSIPHSDCRSFSTHLSSDTIGSFPPSVEDYSDWMQWWCSRICDLPFTIYSSTR